MKHIIKPANEAFDALSSPEDALFFFDFDGVLASQDEEKLFRLSGSELERSELEALAELMGLNHSLYPSTEKLRHILFQAQAMNTPVTPHEQVLSFIRDIEDMGHPYFIITARSALWAVHRMMAFIENHNLSPVEVFCLGRSSKATLLHELRQEWPDRPFIFFEDLEHNIEAALALNDPLLKVIEIVWDPCTKEAQALRKSHLGI